MTIVFRFVKRRWVLTVHCSVFFLKQRCHSRRISCLAFLCRFDKDREKSQKEGEHFVLNQLALSQWLSSEGRSDLIPLSPLGVTVTRFCASTMVVLKSDSQAWTFTAIGAFFLISRYFKWAQLIANGQICCYEDSLGARNDFFHLITTSAIHCSQAHKDTSQKIIQPLWEWRDAVGPPSYSGIVSTFSLVSHWWDMEHVALQCAPWRSPLLGNGWKILRLKLMLKR